MKVAILHEMLIKKWGAEKVVENLISIFPDADLYTLIYDEKKMWNVFPKETIHLSCRKLISQKIYNICKKQRFCLPVMKQSVESLDFSTYDRVIVSSSWFAHGLQTGKDTKTIIYYHAPARYMWDWAHEYRKEIWMNRGLKWFIFWKLMLSLRQWDYEVAQKNDILLSNSSTTQKRIYKYYRRDSQVLYPPIETSRFEKHIQTQEVEKIFSFINKQLLESQSPIGWVLWVDQRNIIPPNSYYIILSALTEFKKIDIAVENFKKLPENNLLIIWNGDYRDSLEKLAGESKNIFFAGAQYGDDLVALVQNSLGLVFPWEEDFWIVPIEVMAAGKPVFALNKWWLTETVIAWKTGDFFFQDNWSDFIKYFQKFHKKNLEWKYRPEDCKKQAKKYDKEIFETEIKKLSK